MPDKKQLKPILVTGSHRSGSTWVGQVLSQAHPLGYMHEPFNPIYPGIASSPIDIWYLYIAAHNSDQYKDYFNKVLQWKFSPMSRLKDVNSSFKVKMWLKYWNIYAKNGRNKKVPLMKDPIAFFSTPWLAKEFDMNVVALIRHPAAFVYSLKRKGWKFPFHHLKGQPELMADWLSHYENDIESYAERKRDIIDQACLFWRILYGTLIRFQEKFPEWYFVKHETISLDPVNEFRKLFKYLDLDFTHQIEEYVKRSSGSDNPSGTVASEEQLKRDSAANTKYWKEKLTQVELEKIKAATADVWPSFYTENDW